MHKAASFDYDFVNEDYEKRNTLVLKQLDEAIKNDLDPQTQRLLYYRSRFLHSATTSALLSGKSTVKLHPCKSSTFFFLLSLRKAKK